MEARRQTDDPCIPGKRREFVKILLINIDSKKMPNLALHKIAKYYLDKGNEVVWDNPLMGLNADRIYVSCIFTKNRVKCLEWENRAEIGGSGWSIIKKLPDEIESIKPHINLGFTTRGCIRKCEFCIVPQKEELQIVGDIYDIWDGKTKDIVLLDNNILAFPKHFKLICSQLRKEKLRIDFNQGLDHRLLNEDIVNELKTIRHSEYHLAFDQPEYLTTVERALKLLKQGGINRCNWLVLVGFNTTFQEDLDRLHFLKENNQNAYVQRYETCYSRPEYIRLARWVNQHHIFQAMTFNQFKAIGKHRHFRAVTELFI